MIIVIMLAAAGVGAWILYRNKHPTPTPPPTPGKCPEGKVMNPDGKCVDASCPVHSSLGSGGVCVCDTGRTPTTTHDGSLVCNIACTTGQTMCCDTTSGDTGCNYCCNPATEKCSANGTCTPKGQPPASHSPSPPPPPTPPASHSPSPPPTPPTPPPTPPPGPPSCGTAFPQGCVAPLTCQTCGTTGVKACCGAGIQCDDNGSCCPNGVTAGACTTTYSCDVSSPGDCTPSAGETCPADWCPTQEYRLCDTVVASQHMYMFLNMGALNITTNLKAFVGPLAFAESNPAMFTSASVAEGNFLIEVPTMPTAYEYLYLDDVVECVCNKDIDPSCTETGDPTPICATPESIWSLLKMGYQPFYPGQSPGLIYKIQCGYTTNQQCQSVPNPNTGPINYVLGLPPHTDPFPTDAKKGTWFQWASDSVPFLPVRNDADDTGYGSWTTGVPWIELENPVCGGLSPGQTKSKYRNPSVPDTGCKLSDNSKCGAVTESDVIGLYAFTRVLNEATNVWYRFYIGVGYNQCDTADITCNNGQQPCNGQTPANNPPRPMNQKNVLVSAGQPFSERTSYQGGTQAVYRPPVAWVMTEDKDFAIETYLLSTAGTAHIPFTSICNSTTKKSAIGTSQLDLFKWTFEQINPLPPTDPNSCWQSGLPNPLLARANCSIPGCDFKDETVYWADAAPKNQCHFANAELPPTYPWVSGKAPNNKQLTAPTDASGVQMNPGMQLDVNGKTALGYGDGQTKNVPLPYCNWSGPPGGGQSPDNYYWTCSQQEGSTEPSVGLRKSNYVFYTDCAEDGVTVDTNPDTNSKNMCDGARATNAELEEISPLPGNQANQYGPKGAKHAAAAACGVFPSGAADVKYLFNGWWVMNANYENPSPSCGGNITDPTTGITASNEKDKIFGNQYCYPGYACSAFGQTPYCGNVGKVDGSPTALCGAAAPGPPGPPAAGSVPVPTTAQCAGFSVATVVPCATSPGDDQGCITYATTCGKVDDGKGHPTYCDPDKKQCHWGQWTVP